MDMTVMSSDVHQAAFEQKYAGSKNSGHKFNHTKWEKHFQDKHGVSHARAKQLVHKHTAKKINSYTPTGPATGEE